MGMDLHHIHRNDPSLVHGQQVSFTYLESQQPACQFEYCNLKAGQVYVLCGKSGSGKSTFLRLVNGIIPEYYGGTLTGDFTIDRCRTGKNSVEEFSRYVASVFQNPTSQFFYQEVKHELVFPCENQAIPPTIIQQRLEKLLFDFNIGALLDQEIRHLSGGQKQLVALATAIMQGTEIMVLDEPTANLDHDGCQRVKRYIEKLKSQGKTLLIAEHRLSYLTEVADQFIYFDEGRWTKTFTKQEMVNLPNDEREQLGLRALSMAPFSKRIKEKTAPFILSDSFCIRNLTVKAGRKILQQVKQMSFRRGKITGITGANGVGKSRLAAYLSGVLEDKVADFTLDEQRLSAKARLKKTAFVMQEVQLQLFADSVWAEVNLGHPIHPDTETVLSRLKLTDLKDRHPMSLSGGEQQRVMIAASLLSDKEIFIFDEPSCGLDFLQMKAVAVLLKHLKAQNKIVILISHDEELLAETCDAFYHLK